MLDDMRSVRRLLSATLILIVFLLPVNAQRSAFVRVVGDKLILHGRTHNFIGTNYWYGSLLGLEKDKKRGVERLRRELDFLKKNGVTNLRLMAGAEGSDTLNGVIRVGPPLQPEAGKFDEGVLEGWDLVLAEMA
jgi:mannan endo-1,4-beta-mannosidase